MGRNHFVVLFAFALVVVALSGCNTMSEPTPEPPTLEDAEENVGAASTLRNTAWAVQSYGVEEQYAPIEDSFPSIDFMGDRYNGYTGCNFMLGVYTVSGSTMQIRSPSMTQGACANDALFQQENGFIAALTAVDEYEVDGEILKLFVGGNQVLTMEPLVPVPFEETTWYFQFLQNDQYEWQPVIPGTSITAVFQGDTISGNAGCNDYTGSVEYAGELMSITDLELTEIGCTEPEGVMEQEQQYIEKLATTGKIDVRARSFELRDKELLQMMLFYAE